jgi:hypothetical protein
MRQANRKTEVKPMKNALLILMIFALTGCTGIADQNRRQAYVAQNQLDDATRDKILEGSVSIGMTADEVTASWGRPDFVNKTVFSWGVHEQWAYCSSTFGCSDGAMHYFYFRDGILDSWQKSN